MRQRWRLPWGVLATAVIKRRQRHPASQLLGLNEQFGPTANAGPKFISITHDAAQPMEREMPANDGTGERQWQQCQYMGVHKHLKSDLDPDRKRRTAQSVERQVPADHGTGKQQWQQCQYLGLHLYIQSVLAMTPQAPETSWCQPIRPSLLNPRLVVLAQRD